MPTIKILFTINSILKKLFLQTTVYKYFRLKKRLVNFNNNNSSLTSYKKAAHKTSVKYSQKENVRINIKFQQHSLAIQKF